MIATLSAPPGTNAYAIRKGVLDFIIASEALLSPALRSSEFTKEECDMIAEYVMTLSNSATPWSKSLPVRYNI
jgi:hypothetical protein